MEPLARIEIGKRAPDELLRLLPLVGIEPLVAPAGGDTNGDGDRKGVHAGPELSVEFADSPEAIRARRTVRVAVRRTAGTERGAVDFIAENPRSAACYILSQALRLPTPFLTADDQMFETLRAAVAIGRGPARIIVEGETGSGKESLMRLMHAASGASCPLRKLDCPAFDERAIAAELGAAIDELRIGAGTGAAGSSRCAGAIFLHRMGELSPAAQARILEILRGCPRAAAAAATSYPPSASIRFFAASSHDLGRAVARGEFLRELRDFFDLTLTLPPLRMRGADLPLLARHYLRRLDPAATLAATALKALADYRFPGNVRELINLVTRLAIASPGPDARAIDRADVLDQLVAANPTDDLPSLWRLSHPSARRALARNALAAAGGDADAAARRLGVATPALIRLTTPPPRPRAPRRPPPA